MKTQGKEFWRLTFWIAIAFGFAVAMFYLDQPFLANVAFLTIGVLLAIIIDLSREAIRRPRQARDLARAIYEELANRVARFVFDFEDPWSKWIDEKNCRPGEVSELRLRKFMPIPPVIYPATAAQMSLLQDGAQQAIILFYVSLAVYIQDMKDIADHCQRNNIDVPLDRVAFLAGRLHRTLSPGLEALEKLSEMVEGHEKIDAAAIRQADSLFKHERANLTLRQRIEHYVRN